jgi:ATP adenylyltransferase
VTRQIDFPASACPFCSLTADQVIRENDHARAFRDLFPVTDGHTLIIPKRHVPDVFALTRDEIIAVLELVWLERAALEEDDASIEGFNVGANAGAAAGQTVFHCHVHLIPRRVGDTPDPRGGVRHVIFDKGNYLRT